MKQATRLIRSLFLKIANIYMPVQDLNWLIDELKEKYWWVENGDAMKRPLWKRLGEWNQHSACIWKQMRLVGFVIFCRCAVIKLWLFWTYERICMLIKCTMGKHCVLVSAFLPVVIITLQIFVLCYAVKHMLI